MKTVTMILFAALAAAAPVSAQAKTTDVLSTSDQAAIAKLQTDWTTAWDRHDPEGLAAGFSENGDLLNPFGRFAKGHDQLVALFKEEHTSRLKDSTYNGTCEPARLLAPDVAEVNCVYTVEGLKGPGSDSTIHGNMTKVVVRSGDEWKVALARAMHPVPQGRPQEKAAARSPQPIHR